MAVSDLGIIFCGKFLRFFSIISLECNTFAIGNVSIDELEKTFYHPENKTTRPLKTIIALYAWHSRHHLAHITELKKRMGW